MRKNIAEDKEKLKEKLSYIGLNLERLPKFLTEFNPFSFRPSKSYNDTSYKVYRYIDVNDIEILLTPTDRLTSLDEKYKLSVPIKNCLDSKTEQNVEYFAAFLKVLNDTNIEEIEKIEKEQERLKQQIPNQVKYEGNYTWQIYYSDVSDQYFMLAPINEYNNAALFYLLKKQIESAGHEIREMCTTKSDSGKVYLFHETSDDVKKKLDEIRLEKNDKKIDKKIDIGKQGEK